MDTISKDAKHYNSRWTAAHNTTTYDELQHISLVVNIREVRHHMCDNFEASVFTVMEALTDSAHSVASGG